MFLVSFVFFSESGLIRFGEGVLLFDPSYCVGLRDSDLEASYSSIESLLLTLL